jgi:hypothetical protein
MDALFFTRAAGRFALGALLVADAGSAEDTGYVEPSVAAAVARVRTAALEKLARPGCRRLFGEFTNLEGTTLDEVLAARNETVESHLRGMAYLDGSRVYPCRRRGVYAFTKPGSLSVFFCENFWRLAWSNVETAANLLIHEMLHSVGAGEAPTPGFPTAYEFTARVESRCGK